MTSPNTEHDDSTLGGPPEYPTSQMMPPEYWRAQPAGDPTHKQVVTIDTPEGPVQREVEPGWNKPVYVGPSEDDPNHGVTGA